jgi:cytochrome c biogenesis protein CcdA
MNVVERGLAGLAGMLSFMSPCCLPLVPMDLGYLSGMAGRCDSSRYREGRVLA